MEEKTKDEINKDNISWNAALSAAYTNVSCVEETLAISVQKAQIQNEQKKFLGNSIILMDKNDSHIDDQDAWSQIVDDSLKKHDNEHKIRIEKMRTMYEDSKAVLEAELRTVDQRLQGLVEEYDEAKKLLTRQIPENIPTKIEDMQNLKDRIEKAKKALEELDEKKNSMEESLAAENEEEKYDIPSEEISPSRGNNLKQILDNTTPRLPTKINRSNFFN